MKKKYKLTDESISFNGKTLYRIEAVIDFSNNFSDVKKGQKGGFIESEYNLSHEGDSWVYDNAKVFDNAEVFGNANVSGNACVIENSFVKGNAKINGHAMISGNAIVCGNANICADEDYIVFKNWWSSNRYFTWTKSNNMWKVGCFYGSGKELIKKAYKDSEKSGREYERIVKYVESILADEKK